MNIGESGFMRSSPSSLCSNRSCSSTSDISISGGSLWDSISESVSASSMCKVGIVNCLASLLVWLRESLELSFWVMSWSALITVFELFVGDTRPYSLSSVSISSARTKWLNGSLSWLFSIVSLTFSRKGNFTAFNLLLVISCFVFLSPSSRDLLEEGSTRMGTALSRFSLTTDVDSFSVGEGPIRWRSCSESLLRLGSRFSFGSSSIFGGKELTDALFFGPPDSACLSFIKDMSVNIWSWSLSRSACCLFCVMVDIISSSRSISNCDSSNLNWNSSLSFTACSKASRVSFISFLITSRSDASWSRCFTTPFSCVFKLCIVRSLVEMYRWYFSSSWRIESRRFGEIHSAVSKSLPTVFKATMSSSLSSRASSNMDFSSCIFFSLSYL